MMDSLELVRRLYQQGTLTKEAALDLLRARERLVKEALRAEATRLWANVASLSKEAGFLGGGPSAAGGRVGFFAKLRRGGLTPGKNPANPTEWSDVGANLLKMIGIAGLSAGATAGVGALLRHRRDRALQGDIERSYQQMFTEIPSLSSLPPETVKTHFGVLARFAPSLAADPTVAGSFVKDTATMGIIQPRTIQTLAETQRRIDEMHEGRSPFGDHFDRGLQLASKAVAPGGRP